MKQHRYRITVEHLELPNGEKPIPSAPLVFETGNHDDLGAIVTRVRQRGDLPVEDAAAFAIGLKLFGEVMLKNRTLPLFAEIWPQFKIFMQTLKRGPQA